MCIFSSFFFFFGGGWVCSWAVGTPRAVGCTTENLQTTAGTKACHLITLYPLGGLRDSASTCEHEAKALGEGMRRNKYWPHARRCVGRVRYQRVCLVESCMYVHMVQCMSVGVCASWWGKRVHVLMLRSLSDMFF